MKKQFILQFYKKCFFILSIIIFFSHIHTSKSQHPSMQLSKDQERILTVESEKNLFLSLRHYNKNNRLNDFIEEELYGTKNPEEEKEKLKKTTLELIQIYAKFGNIYDNRSTMMIENAIGFICYELYKRESEKKRRIIEGKIEQSSEKLFEFRPFNNLIHEYKKILENSGERNIKNRVLHVKKVILLTCNDLYAIDNPSEKLPTLTDLKLDGVSKAELINSIVNQKKENLKLQPSEINQTNELPPKSSINPTNEQNEINNNSAKFQSYFKCLLAFFGLSYLGYKLYQWSKKSSSNL